jgi:hypothetical protein
MRAMGPTNDGVSFINDGACNVGSVNLVHEGKRGTNKSPVVNKSNITCHRCNQKGHYASECNTYQNATPKKPADPTKQSGAQMLMAAVESGEFDYDEKRAFQLLTHSEVVLQSDGIKNGSNASIPSSWILLDNQSTVDVFQNKDLLTNIRRINGHMDIHCNAGTATTSIVGDLRGYGTVWYHPQGIANILSLSRVRDRGYVVAYDNKRNVFSIHKHGRSTHVFHHSSRGLYYMDTNCLRIINDNC